MFCVRVCRWPLWKKGLSFPPLDRAVPGSRFAPAPRRTGQTAFTLAGSICFNCCIDLKDLWLLEGFLFILWTFSPLCSNKAGDASERITTDAPFFSSSSRLQLQICVAGKLNVTIVFRFLEALSAIHYPRTLSCGLGFLPSPRSKLRDIIFNSSRMDIFFSASFIVNFGWETALICVTSL